MLKKTVAAVAAALVALAAGSATAQQFPTRPITMIVPFQAGGPTDTVGRTISAAMGRALGQPVQVQIVDGAGGTIGAQRVADAAPDGYTILLYHVGMATTPTLFPNLGYDPLTDFAEIGLLTEVPMVLVTRQRMPFTTFPQMLTYLGANLDRVTMAHAGIGSASHLCSLMFREATGLDIVTVAYPGVAQAILDLQADFVDIMCDQTTSMVSNVQAGTFIGYASTSAEPIDALDGVPTFASLGYPALTFSVWHGLWAPAGTPPDVIARLNTALKAALTDRQVRQTFSLFATDISPLADQTPEALRARVESEIERWRPILTEAGEFAQ